MHSDSAWFKAKKRLQAMSYSLIKLPVLQLYMGRASVSLGDRIIVTVKELRFQLGAVAYSKLIIF